MLRLRFDIPISFLIVNNAVPILGLLFYDWKVFDLLFFFWIEMMTILFFAIFKIILAKKPEPLPFRYNEVGNHVLTSQLQVKWAALILFLILYGIYMGFFLLMLHKLTGSFFENEFLVLAIAPGLSHLVSFVVNYLGKKEYLVTTSWNQIWKPFWRTVPIVTVLAFASLFGQYVTLIVFLFIKILGDYWTHLLEHDKDKILIS